MATETKKSAAAIAYDLAVAELAYLDAFDSDITGAVHEQHSGLNAQDGQEQARPAELRACPAS